MIIVAEDDDEKYLRLDIALRKLVAPCQRVKDWQALRVMINDNGTDHLTVCLDVGYFPDTATQRSVTRQEVIDLASELVSLGCRVSLWSVVINPEAVQEDCLCVMDQRDSEVIGLLAEFLAGAPARTMVGKVQLGKVKRTLEAKLQVLSALFPIGLLWETAGNASEALCEVVDRLQPHLLADSQNNEASCSEKIADNLPECERLVQQYACYKLLEGRANGKARAGELRTELLRHPMVKSLARKAVEDPDGQARNSPGDVLDRLDRMLSATSPQGWNIELTRLRDEWIVERKSAAKP